MSEQSEAINELAAALSKAQGQIKGALKDSANPFFKSKYADLASVWDACRQQLSDNGLAVVQTTCDSATGISVVTSLIHSSGQWMRGHLTLEPKDKTPQGYGSAITYARRYALAAIVGVAPEDDDGNAASGNKGSDVATLVKIDPKQKKEFAEQVRAALANGDEAELQKLWGEWDTDEKVVLWALFNSQERSSMKSIRGAA